jgi:hypothetical protein
LWGVLMCGTAIDVLRMRLRMSVRTWNESRELDCLAGSFCGSRDLLLGGCCLEPSTNNVQLASGAYTTSARRVQWLRCEPRRLEQLWEGQVLGLLGASQPANTSPAAIVYE